MTVKRIAVGSLAGIVSMAAAQTRPVTEDDLHFKRPIPNLESNIDRPLRYRPEGDDFVIENGKQFFNRALYGGNSAFRVEAGDKPEFVLYLPGRGGNLRLGLRTSSGGKTSSKWMHSAESVTARYRPGGMVYEIRDPLLGANGSIHLEAYALALTEGLILRVEQRGDVPAEVELVWAFGGITGVRGARDGDIGTEKVPISQYFQLKPEFCKGNSFEMVPGAFRLNASAGTIFGRIGDESDAFPRFADAVLWDDPENLFTSTTNSPPEFPVAVGSLSLKAGEPRYLLLQRLTGTASQDTRKVAAAQATLLSPMSHAELPKAFTDAQDHFNNLRERVAIDTPDPYINAAVRALNVAADAAWDENENAIMHGAIAWRVKLLGWRGPYALDALGWHDRARANIEYWITRQNLKPIPEAHAPPDENTNLARSEAALHTNGNLTSNHYDMNVGFFDVVFRHLLWTGDVEFAAQVWPVLERHLAWERRSFRREFGPDKLPLYENYAATWASDDLYYSGGGTAHLSAYNYSHNRMAARVARLIGKDPSPYDGEAELILQAMRKYLWIPGKGWYAEYRDLLGNQLLHESASLWNVYHTTDSEAVDPVEAWQLSRYLDQMPHLPVRGPGVPSEPDGTQYALLPITTWMPYSWSINNVCMNECAHAALSYWQSGRIREGYLLLKSSILSGMFMGIAPGNVGTMTYHDVYRREAQRDFADGSGTLSRAIVNGLFGVLPDALSGELHLKPGFPESWDRASFRHPKVAYAWKRTGQTDTFTIESKFDKPMSLRLTWPAFAEQVAEVSINGAPANWTELDSAVGFPRIVIIAPAGTKWDITIQWKGNAIADPPAAIHAKVGDTVKISPPAATATDGNILDPQKVFAGDAQIADNPGEHTVFVPVKQGAFNWLMPVNVIVASPVAAAPAAIDWSTPATPAGTYETLDLSKFFNLRVSEIFKQEYRSPRSPYVSLAIPKQGIGGWAGNWNKTANIDDTGLRALAGKNGRKIILPNGVPFATPSGADALNIAFTSLWDNFPKETAVPLTGKAKHLYLLMAGSTNFMQSRFDNGEVVVTYTDGSAARLALNNPVNWWPIEQDYFIDDYQFHRPQPIPPRVDLKTGKVRLLDPESCKGRGGLVDGGAATVLDLKLNPAKELKSLTLRTIANDVVIGLMSATLER